MKSLVINKPIESAILRVPYPILSLSKGATNFWSTSKLKKLKEISKVPLKIRITLGQLQLISLSTLLLIRPDPWIEILGTDWFLALTHLQAQPSPNVPNLT